MCDLNIDTTNMPTYLSEYLIVTDWYIDFLAFFECLLNKELKFDKFSNVIVEFSNDIIKEKFGIPFEKIKKIIIKKYGNNKEINEILDKLKEGINPNYIGQLAEIICHYNHNVDYNTVKDELESLFELFGCTSTILGQYINNTKTIILYTKAIEECATRNELEKEEVFKSTFIHEFFHAAHYIDADSEEIIKRNDYTSKIVKESLASRFEAFYCKILGITYYKLIEDSWNRYSVFVYPYSGAKFIESSTSFSKIYELSISDMDGALRLLLPKDEFYAFKNKKENRIFTLKKKEIRMSKATSSRDYSKYEFDGNMYSKNQLVLAVVKKYFSENSFINFDDLISVFPKSLQGSKGVIKKYDDLSKDEKEKRFFTDKTDILILNSGIRCVVCNQWGVPNIGRFIDKAKELGYSIEKITY